MSGTEIALYVVIESRCNVVTKAFVFIPASYFAMSEKWTDSEQNRAFFGTRFFAIWMSEWLVKGYFPGPPTAAGYRMKIYRALKCSSDVRVMDRDTRTSESVVCACLTLRMRFISRSIRRIIVAISGKSDAKVCSPRGKTPFRKVRKIWRKNPRGTSTVKFQTRTQIFLIRFAIFITFVERLNEWNYTRCLNNQRYILGIW